MAAHPNDFAVLDAFTRANTGPPAGPGWANVGHWGDPVGYITTGNQMAPSGGGWRADHWTATYSRAAGAVAFGITLAVPGSGAVYYFLFADHAAMTGYALRSDSGTWTLGWFDGSFNSLATYTQASAAGDGICLIADADTHLTAWHRTGGVWTKKADVVDTTYGGALYPGISAANTAGRWDDMFGGLPAGGPVDTTITAPFLAANTQTYAPTLANAAAQDIAAPFLSAATQVFAPTLENAAAQEIVAPFLPSQTQTWPPTLTNESEPEPEPTTITAPFLPAQTQTHPPVLENAAAQEITAPFLPPQTQTWPPSLTNAGIPETTIHAPFLPAVERTFAPTLTTTRSPAAPPVYPRPVEETIILRGEGGQWMVVGQGAARGIVHEGLSMSADRAGPSTCSFTLKRDPGQSWPDLAPYNECIVEIGGVRVWSGRMREAPGQSGTANTISFTGSGWQSHLDDDLLAMGWVHTRLSEWRDMTTFPSLAGVASAPSGLTVTNEGGEILIGWPAGQTIKQNIGVGVMIDFGEQTPGPTRVIVEVSMPVVNPWTTVYVRGTAGGAMFTAPVNDFGTWASGSLVAGQKKIIGGSVGSPQRYVAVFIHRGTGDQAATAEHVLRIHRIQAFADGANEAFNESNLHASTVIRNVVTSGSLPRLSRDTSRIFTSGFAIPDYWPAGFQSPRELMEPVNAFHDWHLGVDVDRRVFFEPPDDRPTVEIGEWSGAEFTDASAGSGEDVYSKVIVQAQDSAGQPLEVIRTAATAVPELAVRVPIDAAVTNPSFETDTAGWTLAGMARSNVSAGHGTWSIRWEVAVGAGTASTTITGLSPGVPHMLTWWGNGGANTSQIDVTITGPAGQEGAGTGKHVTGGGERFSVVWVPRGDTATVRFACAGEDLPGVGPYIYLDDVRVSRLEVNAVDRHRFARAQRLPIGAPLSRAAAEVIGDIWLRNHITTTLKGSVAVTGQGGVREVIGGAPVHPAHLLLRAGECIRHAGMADPDTGAWGRVGRIASVSYTGGRATIEIDNERHAFDALISRYAALAGQVR